MLWSSSPSGDVTRIVRSPHTHTHAPPLSAIVPAPPFKALVHELIARLPALTSSQLALVRALEIAVVGRRIELESSCVVPSCRLWWRSGPRSAIRISVMSPHHRRFRYCNRRVVRTCRCRLGCRTVPCRTSPAKIMTLAKTLMRGVEAMPMRIERKET